MRAAACQHHSDLLAVGVCVRCHTRLCAACITKLAGINHCHACLAALAAAMPQAPSPSPELPASWLGPSVGVLVLSALSWLMLNALLPGRGPP